ncbi:hypothetical protein [Pseudomarimonas arenosa]|uniref:Uncharacterized protein n=1 Tax=Pseudomarimonas arenosa TaxID=2774145 RepID=A0AAW3ZQ86_9GAMM|nr:hypothetical protein [Pseudomarimonas arenosa]MBD8526762.1 hypothetical protein [Pseudomarimonas arenosa]
MMAVLMFSALSVQCVDGLATVDPEVYEAERNEVIEWQADFAFRLSFDSEGNGNLPSHKKDGKHVRTLPAARLRVGENTYSVESDDCFGDPVIIVR